MWDIILTKRLAELNFPVVYGFATDDAHIYHKWGPEHANPGSGWVVVRARHLTPESIIKAMDAGDFYASTGVVLKDIQLDGKTFKIVIEPEKGVSYTTQFIGTMRGYDPTSKPVLDEEGNDGEGFNAWPRELETRGRNIKEAYGGALIPRKDQYGNTYPYWLDFMHTLKLADADFLMCPNIYSARLGSTEKFAA